MITTSTRRRIPDDVYADWGTEENPDPTTCLETGIRTSGLPLLNPDHERINEQINKRITWNSGLYLYLYQILGFEAAEVGHNSKLKAKLGEVSKPQPWKFFVRGGGGYLPFLFRNLCNFFGNISSGEAPNGRLL